MSNLDDMLTRIGSAPLPPRLAIMDEAVFSALAERQGFPAGGSLQSIGLAGIAALALGLFSTSFPGNPAVAAPSITPFGAPPALAPSSLLLASK